MPRIRTWQTQTSASTSRAQLAPLQTRVTGTRRAFLQDYQPAKTGNQVYSEERRNSQYKDNQANILTQAAVSAVGAFANHQINKARANANAADQAYKAETDSLLDEAKSNYANEAARISAEQKYKPVQDVDENGNPIFASDQIEKNYNDAVTPFGAEAEAVFANRKDSARAQQEFNKWRNSIDLSHKKKLYNEGAAISFKHAQERTKIAAFSVNSEFELERILKTASDNEIFSDTELYELKMTALEKVHTNRFSTTIDQLGAQMPSMSDEQFSMVRDDLVSQLWDDNDSLIITEGNRNDMIRKIQAMDNVRGQQIEQFNDKNYLKAMQDYAASGGNKAVLQAALSENASDVFGHENSLKMINMLSKDSPQTQNKEAAKMLFSSKTLDYKMRKITKDEYLSFAIDNMHNTDTSQAFNIVEQQVSQQQSLDIKATKDLFSYQVTGTRSSDFDNVGTAEQRAQLSKLESQLSAFIAENPNGDVRSWGIATLAKEPIDTEALSIEGVQGDKLYETNWEKIYKENQVKMKELEVQLQNIKGPERRTINDQMRQLKNQASLIQRYRETWVNLNSDENKSILQTVLGGIDE